VAFSDQTAAFFDELSSILDEEQRVREKHLEGMSDGQGPYSNLLTQDETPYAHYNPIALEEPPPEVITRGG
jgi:hypothetical protein